MLFKEAVSLRIYELCDKYDYSPNKLAELSSIPNTTFESMILKRVTNPSARNIYKICRTLKIDVKEFYNSSLFDFNNIEDEYDT